MGTTVVIPQRNRGGARLWNCLNALNRQTVPPESVIVSDLSSEEEHLDNIRGITLGLGATFLCVEWRNPRFSRAVAINCGIRASRSEAVLVLDVDCVAAPHCIETLEDRLKPGTLLLAEHRRGRAPAEGEDISTDWGRYNAESAPNKWTHIAPGMFMAAYRSFWGRIGGIDERFLGWGAEDDHAVWKAELLGEIEWIDNPMVIHQDHPDVPGKGADKARNEAIFQRITAGGQIHQARWGIQKVKELIRP